MMKNNLKYLTTAQFAKLHNVNKRTLHYYDDIGLFCPKAKGENGYRYYDTSQSIDFEYIRMLKELNMSIKEITEYYKSPTPDKFLKIADVKEKEIDNEIQKLKQMKKALKIKKDRVAFCDTLQDQKIKIEKIEEEKIFVLPYDFENEDVTQMFKYVKDKWSIEQIRMGIGSIISINKVLNETFEKYDGIYTFATGKSNSSKCVIKPKGKYLCGYQKGPWDKLPNMYKKMIEYSKQNNLKLTGYAYEIGLNEFVISTPNEYITKIMIKIDE